MTQTVQTMASHDAPDPSGASFGHSAVGRFGFVIDPSRHAVYAGPSSFVGWSGRTSP